MAPLRFKLLGFPVQVLPGFWLLLAMLALLWQVPPLVAVVVGAVAFVSVLVHELGHALMARAFGLRPQITLHMMGGVTLFGPGPNLTRGRDIAISAAGPLAGLLLGGLALVALQKAPAQSAGLAWVAVSVAAQINLYWSLFNLVPVVPFDGGRILLAALGPKRRAAAGYVSLGFGVAAVAVLLRFEEPIAAFLVGSSAVSSFFRMRDGQRQVAAPLPEPAARRVLRQARHLLETQPLQAAALLEAVLRGSTEPEVRKEAITLLAWARLRNNEPAVAREIVLGAGTDALDAYLVAAVHEATGHLDAARSTIVRARQGGDSRSELQALLVKVLIGLGDIRTAAVVTREIAGALADEEIERVALLAAEAGELEQAGELLLVLTRRPSASLLDRVLDAVRTRSGLIELLRRLEERFAEQL